MLGVLRTYRVWLSPLTAGIFVLGVAMAPGVASVHPDAPPEPGTPSAPEAGHGHHPGHHDPGEPDPPEHGPHGCDLCACFAAAGGCSAPALAGAATSPADAFVVLSGGPWLRAFPPGTSPPHDIFRPPRI